MNEDKQQTTKNEKKKMSFSMYRYLCYVFLFFIFFWRNFGHNLFCFLKQLSLFHSFTHTHTRPHSETRHYLMLLILSKSDFHLKLVFVLICSNLFFSFRIIRFVIIVIHPYFTFYIFFNLIFDVFLLLGFVLYLWSM